MAGIRDLIARRRPSHLPASERHLPLSSFRRELERLFEDFFPGWEVGPWRTENDSFTPSVNVSETGESIKVTAELPGIDEKDLNLTLTDNVLSITGEKKEESEKKDEGTIISESSYGRFERQIPLPAEVREDGVEATYNKGVLTVVLPKLSEHKASRKKIAVKSG